MDADAIMTLFKSVFPQAVKVGFTIESVTGGAAVVQLTPDERHLRPGGTVSGPTLMTMADTAAYVAVLGHYGPEALAVTSSLEIHFLRKPPMTPLRSEARLIKHGRRLAVALVTQTSEGVEGPVAHATVTYALPASPSTQGDAGHHTSGGASGSSNP